MPRHNQSISKWPKRKFLLIIPKKTLNVKWKSDKSVFLSSQKFEVRINEKRSAILASTRCRVSRENSRDCWTSFDVARLPRVHVLTHDRACNGWVRMVMTGQETPARRQRAASGHDYLQSPRNIGVTTLRNSQGRCKQNQFLSNCDAENRWSWCTLSRDVPRVCVLRARVTW